MIKNIFNHFTFPGFHFILIGIYHVILPVAANMVTKIKLHKGTFVYRALIFPHRTMEIDRLVNSANSRFHINKSRLQIITALSLSRLFYFKKLNYWYFSIFGSFVWYCLKCIKRIQKQKLLLKRFQLNWINTKIQYHNLQITRT